MGLFKLVLTLLFWAIFLLFESVGFLVDKLTRERIDIFNLEGLSSGEYRKLTPKEVQIIYSYKK